MTINGDDFCVAMQIFDSILKYLSSIQNEVMYFLGSKIYLSNVDYWDFLLSWHETHAKTTCILKWGIVSEITEVRPKCQCTKDIAFSEMLSKEDDSKKHLCPFSSVVSWKGTIFNIKLYTCV